MWYKWIASNYNDNDLIPTNVKDGVDIFGVEGDLISSALEWLELSIVYWKSDFTNTEKCQWSRSVIAETAGFLYMIFPSSWDDWSDWDVYNAYLWVVKYDKLSHNIIMVWNIDTDWLYTSQPYHIWSYQDWNIIRVNMQAYQQVAIFSINTDTDTLSVWYNTIWSNWTPNTNGTQIHNSLVYNWSTVAVNTYKLPRDWTTWHWQDWFLWNHYLS